MTGDTNAWRNVTSDEQSVVPSVVALVIFVNLVEKTGCCFQAGSKALMPWEELREVVVFIDFGACDVEALQCYQGSGLLISIWLQFVDAFEGLS